MPRTHRFTWLLAGLLSLASARPGMASGNGPSALLIGLLLPPEEAEAISLRQGALLGVEHANSSREAKATLLVRGRVGQWGTDGEEAGRMVIDDGVRGLIAPPGGAPSHLALQVSGRTATPVISLCSDLSVTGAGIPWMARLVPSNLDEAQMLLKAFKAKAGQDFSWCAVVPTERAGRETAKDLRAAAAAIGGHLQELVQVAPTTTNFSAALKQVVAARPDGMLIWLDSALAGRLVKSLRAAGYTGLLAGPSRLDSAAFTANAGQAAEGFVVASPVLNPASQAVADRFATEYVRRYAQEPDLTARMAYDAAVLLVNVLGKSGDIPTYRAFPLTGDYPGASGSLKFDRSGNRIIQLELVAFRNGHLISINGKMTHSDRDKMSTK